LKPNPWRNGGVLDDAGKKCWAIGFEAPPVPVLMSCFFVLCMDWLGIRPKNNLGKCYAFWSRKKIKKGKGKFCFLFTAAFLLGAVFFAAWLLLVNLLFLGGTV
jgi:hypothetical protein